MSWYLSTSLFIFIGFGTGGVNKALEQWAFPFSRKFCGGTEWRGGSCRCHSTSEGQQRAGTANCWEKQGEQKQLVVLPLLIRKLSNWCCPCCSLERNWMQYAVRKCFSLDCTGTYQPWIKTAARAAWILIYFGRKMHQMILFTAFLQSPFVWILFSSTVLSHESPSVLSHACCCVQLARQGLQVASSQLSVRLIIILIIFYIILLY